ncbi:hypothetical protein BDM02DRAFT_3193992 [Thelephora ganbajun]|uniref:Uncharacterized protein n=1 Tax=Thelephora ganbajun TaxID=370292 RepID=A0ACB6YXP9_THEGA|nr:hypothetical protein BDM02DRAFT_3193992 [Thelephora ganbajun]
MDQGLITLSTELRELRGIVFKLDQDQDCLCQGTNRELDKLHKRYNHHCEATLKMERDLIKGLVVS